MPKIHLKRITLFLFTLSAVFITSNAVGQTANFTVTNGAEIRCYSDSVVNITIVPNPAFVYESIELYWGDGASEEILPGESLDRTHTFSTYQFLEECSYVCNAIPPSNGFCFQVGIIVHYPDVQDENNAKVITFKIPPRVEFEPDATLLCAGEELCLANLTCPDNDEDMEYTWSFSNGAMSSAQDTCIVFDDPGSYAITLTATNMCGTDTEVKFITVLGEPTGDVAFSESGGNSMDTIACAPYVVSFVNNSENGSSYHWEISWDGNVVLDSITGLPTPLDFPFTAPGEYTVTMTTTNLCGEAVWEQVFIINDVPSAVLAEVNPACDSLFYTPEVTYEGGTIDSYFWTFENAFPNTSAEAFPADIVFDSAGIHLVTVVVENFCGIDTAEIMVEIQQLEMVQIGDVGSPFCNNGDTISLEGFPPGGIWTGAGIIADSLFIASGAGEGFHELTYSYGAGVCFDSAAIEVEVLPITPVEAGDDLILCEDADPVNLLNFSPSNGTWSGAGIIDPNAGIFDPGAADIGANSLTYSFLDANGCLFTDNLDAMVEGLPVVQIPDTVTVCDIAEDIELPVLLELMPDPAGGVGVWQGPGIVDNQNGVFNSGIAGNGLHEIIFTYTSPTTAACVTIDTFSLEVIAPTEAVAGPDTAFCISDSIVYLSAMPSGGVWSGDAITDPDLGEFDLIQAAAGIHTLTYTIFPGTTCEKSDDIQVEIIDFAGVDAGENVMVCESETSINLIGSEGNIGAWAGDPAVQPDGTVLVSQLDTGSYLLTYTLSDENVGCASFDEMELIVSPLPVVAFSVDSACVGVPAQFINETEGAVAYEWDFGFGPVFGPDQEFTFDTGGDYPVTLTAYTLDSICEQSITQTVHIISPPEFVGFSTAPQSGCADLEVVLENQSQGESLNFSWYQDTTLVSQEDGPVMLILPSGRADTTYYLSLEVGNGCGGDVALDSVVVLPLPVAEFGTNQNNYCSGEEVDIINISYGNPDSFTWDFGDPSILNSNDSIPPQLFYLADSTVTRTITLITSNLCGSDTISRDIIIHPTEVEAFFNVDQTTVCAGDTVCFSNFSTFGADLVYDFGDGNVATEANPCHVFEDPGTYTVELTASACGFDSTLVQVTVMPSPELNFDVPPIACPGDPFTVNDSSQLVASYLWDFGDGTTSTLSSPEHVYDNPGDYSIALFATSSNGCTSQLTKDILIEALPEALFSVQDSLCAGTAVIFENNSTNIGSCFWDFGDGNFASDCDISHTYTMGDSTYFAKLIITNNAGCTDTIMQPVFIRGFPEPDFEIIGGGCAPAVLEFNNLSVGADSYEWTFSNGFTSSNTNPSFAFDNASSIIVSLEATNDGICTATLEQEFEIHEVPVAAFVSSEAEGCEGDLFSFENQSEGDIVSNIWTFGGQGGSVIFAESPEFTFPDQGVFDVELIVNTDYCSDTTSQQIEIYENIEAAYSTTDLICFNEPTGLIEVEISGGTAPFQYNWYNGASSPGLSQLF
ncbi:MAG: PKD domain-containing protein, partial [Bacteroidetes bacterium]